MVTDVTLYTGVAVARRHDCRDGLPPGHPLHHQDQRGLRPPLRLLRPGQCRGQAEPRECGQEAGDQHHGGQPHGGDHGGPLAPPAEAGGQE